MVNDISRFVLTLGLLLTTGCASQEMAQTASADSASCDNGDTAALAACMEARQALAAARLESVLVDVLQGQPAEVTAAAREEQAAWRQYYDAACRYWLNRETFGREGQIVHYPACRTGLLDIRTAQLKSMFDRTR